MQKYFSLIDDCLREYGDQIDLKLNPGISVSERALIRTQLDADVPDAFLDLYSWHNGQDRRCGPMFFPYYWMPIDSIIVSRVIFREDFQIISQPASPSWVPFLENDTGDCICVDPSGFSTGIKNQLISFVHDDGSLTSPIFTSIEKWIEYLALALSEKVLKPEPYSQCLEMYGSHNELVALMNRVDPGCPRHF